MICRSLWALALTCLTVSLFAQYDMPKMGEFPAEELSMTTYEPYPEAGAVVMEEYAETRVNFGMDSGESTQKIYRRIKILDKNEFDRGNVKLHYYSHQNYRGLTQPKAQITQPDGTVIEVDVKKEGFREQLSDYTSTLSFSYPDVQVGSILEYSYLLKSPDLTPNGWSFHDDIPTKTSVLEIKAPIIVDFVALLYCSRIESRDKQKSATVVHIKNDPNLVGKPHFLPATEEGQFVVGENMPPLREVAYISTPRNYLSRIDFLA